jgi:hypothetical protein
VPKDARGARALELNFILKIGSCRGEVFCA